ncbi:MAG: S8 family serine peptidase [Chloroflexi bacterium]|nr:S8 family serine peptidase [Chloroflexota bacterium]
MPFELTSTAFTEGDSILLANQVRQLGFDGSGVKVGVISDGANNWTTARATGDLPASITVFGTCTPRSPDASRCDRGRTCNEGTAMLEIIHDIAPGAQLAMGSVNTDLEFVQRVNDLVNNFGADVIVDDLGFFDQPYFADGMVAQAVAAVTNQTIFISAAGNSAQWHYEINYLPDFSEGFDLHNFGQAVGAPTDVSMNVLINPGQFVFPVLQWNDPFGGSANDYDLWLVNEAETDFLCPTCASEELQTGFQDPIEGLCYFNNTGNPVRGKIAIRRFSGIAKRLEMFVLGGQVEEYNIPDGSVFGHAAVPDVLAIGAINASDPGNDNIAPYSSRGPSRIDFPSIQIRQKPDITAIDGVSVTGAGGFPSVFFGTSAAAPHVAGVAALLKQLTPATTPAIIRTALMSSAVDLGSSGVDNTFGAGRVNALAALNAMNSDNDGVPDISDVFPLNPNESVDTDGDGVGNNADADDDNDGMPDSYELTHALNPLNPNDAAQDKDGDGFSNRTEFRAETDPSDPASIPRVANDLIIDFGAPYGIWVKYNNDESTWTKLHALSPELIATGDLDGNGQDDAIIDFGSGLGLWTRLNNSGWVKLHDLSPEGMVSGNLDGN